MKRELRVWHDIVWHIMVIVISIFIILAITNIPKKVYQDKLFQEPSEQSDWPSQNLEPEN